MVSFGIVGETQNAYETEEKMEMAKQDTTKTSFLTLSGSKISIVVTGIVPKTSFSIFNRLNFHFRGIPTIIPVL